MRLKTVVLRESATVALAASSKQVLVAAIKPKGGGGSAKGVTLEVKETTTEERRGLRAQKGTFIAPSMPMALVKGLGATDKAGAKPPTESWGIAAVNAKPTQPALAGKGVIVAVLDTGIDPTHPAFAGMELVRKNFTTESDDDLDGHGTHCAGTIFGRDVEGCRIGVAPAVSKALIAKVIGKEGASTEKVVEAIFWALGEGANVISMSLGIDFAGFQRELVEKENLPQEQATSIALAGYRDTVRMFDQISEALSGNAAIMRSAVVVAAAGNESNRPIYSITVAPPAAATRFLSVAAVGAGTGAASSFQMANFSNDGAMFAAPGVDIWSAQAGGGLVAESGTSMATPHVAGVAARWISKLIADKTPFTAAKVIELMKDNSVAIPGILEADASNGLVNGPK